jgi:hypothetical protein
MLKRRDFKVKGKQPPLEALEEGQLRPGTGCGTGDRRCALVGILQADIAYQPRL